MSELFSDEPDGRYLVMVRGGEVVCIERVPERAVVVELGEIEKAREYGLAIRGQVGDSFRVG